MTWLDALRNWLWAGLGNLVGAALFVGLAYWYLYASAPSPEPSEPGDQPPAGSARDGRVAREG